jgi:hypothetical protein
MPTTTRRRSTRSSARVQQQRDEREQAQVPVPPNDDDDDEVIVDEAQSTPRQGSKKRRRKNAKKASGNAQPPPVVLEYKEYSPSVMYSPGAPRGHTSHPATSSSSSSFPAAAAAAAAAAAVAVDSYGAMTGGGPDSALERALDDDDEGPPPLMSFYSSAPASQLSQQPQQPTLPPAATCPTTAEVAAQGEYKETNQWFPSNAFVSHSHSRLIDASRERERVRNGFDVPFDVLAEQKAAAEQKAQVERAAADAERKKKEEEDKPTLTDDQRRVYDAVMEGKNVFFTGSAGSGKSFTMRYLIAEMRKRQPGVFVTAMTGMAALNIGGQTLHSFAGIGNGNSPVETLQFKVAKGYAGKEHWRKASVLFVDECSMMSCELFGKLVEISNFVRNWTGSSSGFGSSDYQPYNPGQRAYVQPSYHKNQPSGKFGGLQIVLCGDFMQLPPVIKQANQHRDFRKYCFESDYWKTVIDESIMLTCNHRQKDMTFLRMLDMVRLGIVTDKTIEMLKSRSIVEVKKREEVERRAIKQQVSVSASSSSLSSSSSSSLSSSSSSSSTAAAVSDSAADSPDTKNATDVKQGAEAGDEFKVGVMKLFPTNAQVRFVNMEGE